MHVEYRNLVRRTSELVDQFDEVVVTRTTGTLNIDVSLIGRIIFLVVQIHSTSFGDYSIKC